MAKNTKELALSLDALTAKVKQLQTELKQLEVGTAAHDKKQKELNKTNAKAKRTSDELAKKTGFLTKTNKNHTASVTAAESAQKRFNASQLKTGAVLGKTGGALLRRISTLGKYLAATFAITAGIKLLNEVFVNSSKRSIEFNKALADVGAVAGLTTQELKKIETTAKNVAGVTSLTQVEVVKLQKELAKLGTSTEDIAGLTKPVALLSQALGTTASETGATLKKIQNQFGLTSDEALATANALVGAVNESALTMQDLGTGLQYVGPLAATAGQTFSETAAMLGVLADNGFKASRAGTGLRSVLAESTKAGVPATDMLRELSAEGLSAARAIDLFGKRGASAAIVLAKNLEEYESLNGQLAESDRLFEANAKQMASTQGQIDLLSSAYNKLSISIGDAITQNEFFRDLTVSLISLFDRDAGRMALAYNVIANSVGLAKDAIDELADAQREFGGGPVLTPIQKVELAWLAVRDTVDITREDFFEKLNKSMDNGLTVMEALEKGTNTFNEEMNEASSAVLGLLTATDELAVSQDASFISTEANTDQMKKLRLELSKLKREAAGGENIDVGKAAGLNELTERQLEIAQEIADLEATGPLTLADEERKRILEAELSVAERLTEGYQALFALEKDEKKGGGKQAIETIRERIRIRKEALKDELQQIKDSMEAEVLRASTIEDLAERDAATAAARVDYAESVSAANRNAAEDISLMVPVLAKNQKIIDKAVDGLQRAANISQTQSINIFGGVLSDFQSSQKELDDLVNSSFEDGGITQAAYEQKTEELRAAFKLQVDNLIATLGIEGEAAMAVRAKMEEFINSPFEYVNEIEGGQSPLEKALGIDPESADFYVEQLKELVGNALEVYQDFGKEKLDNLKNESDAELDIVKQRYSIEEDILKSSLDNQLITEGQFRVKMQELKKAQLAEENAINEKLFNEQKKQDRNNAVAAGIESIAQATILAYTTSDPFIKAPIQAALSSGVIAATTAAKLGAISTRKFFPKKFEDGGMVSGPSHAEGGVPFTVQGRGGYEMEGGEYIINKRSASMHKELLDRINNSGRTAAVQGTQKFAQGGEVIGSQENSTEQYLKLLVAGNSELINEAKKPTRAFVSSADLRTDSRERSIRNNNDRV